MRVSSLRPAYLDHRIHQLLFERRHPEAPWLTPSAVLLLDSWLRPTDTGLEWGSGRSTHWFASRVARLISVESDQTWHARVATSLSAAGLASKVDQRLVLCEGANELETEEHAYIDVVRELPDQSLDFVLVDGRLRLGCLCAAREKVRPGGLLILDNANRFVPNQFGGHHSTVSEPRDQPFSARWREVLESLASWRAVLTSNGLWDTRIWVRPG